MKREDILDEAKRLITGDRAQTYGDAEDTHARIGAVWGGILGVDEIEPEIVAIMLAGMKLVRAAKQPSHYDSFVDIAGYAAIGGEISFAADVPITFLLTGEGES